jgi:putative flavoprotein involved in K+ transport
MQKTFDTIVIGGGQAGLAAGYYLAQQGRDFAILDANARTGDSWRSRWDSLQLFTPAKYSSLPGWAFPAPPGQVLGKDAVADYLEQYAGRFHLPVHRGVRVGILRREQDHYVVGAGDRQFEARHVVVATGAYSAPRLPAFASELDPAIHQIHSSRYRNPLQLPAGDTLIVGAGNSGGEIAMELAQTRRVLLAGTPAGIVPKLPPKLATPLMWWLLHTAATLDTPFGRRMKKQTANKGTPLEGISENDFQRAGVVRLPAATGTRAGKLLVADGRVVDVANVIWATGYRHDFSWIKLPILGTDGLPQHDRGVVPGEAGLYFLGLPFQYSASSVLIGGAGRDAKHVAAQITARSPAHPETAPDENGRRVKQLSRG